MHPPHFNRHYTSGLQALPEVLLITLLDGCNYDELLIHLCVVGQLMFLKLDVQSQFHLSFGSNIFQIELCKTEI